MQKILVIFLLFGLPFVILPLGISYFEVPKVILAETSIEFLLIWQFFSLRERPLSKINTKILYLLFVLFLLTILDLLILSTPTTFFGNIYRLQGIFLLWNLVIFSLISNKFDLKNNLVTKIAFGALCALSIFALLMGGNLANRAIGTLGDPNALAASAIFIYPFIILGKTKKIIKLAATFLILYLIIITLSRSALLGFLLEVGLFVALNLRINLKISVIFILLILVFSYAYPFFEGGNWLENRSKIWETAIIAPAIRTDSRNLSFKQVLLGGGFGNIEEILNKTSWIISNNIRFQYVDSAHNIFLDWWIQGGLVGLSLIFLLLFYTFSNLMKNKNYLYLLILVGLLAVLSFNPVSVVTLVQFWYTLGQGFTKISNA